VVIACNGSGPNTFVSSFAYVGQTIAGKTTFGSPILLKAGVTSYHGDDEELAILIDEPPYLSRWGDYSATTLDPNDPNHFWTIQMYPSATSIYATEVTELIVTPTYPGLSIVLANNNATVSWPSSASAYHLETTADVSSTGWSSITQNLSTNNNQISFTTPVGAAPAFFRLKN
jgi:hypothetical protein